MNSQESHLQHVVWYILSHVPPPPPSKNLYFSIDLWHYPQHCTWVWVVSELYFFAYVHYSSSFCVRSQITLLVGQWYAIDRMVVLQRVYATQGMESCEHGECSLHCLNRKDVYL